MWKPVLARGIWNSMSKQSHRQEANCKRNFDYIGLPLYDSTLAPGTAAYQKAAVWCTAALSWRWVLRTARSEQIIRHKIRHQIARLQEMYHFPDTPQSCSNMTFFEGAALCLMLQVKHLPGSPLIRGSVSYLEGPAGARQA